MVLKKKRRLRRLYRFNNETLLRQLFNNKAYSYLDSLLEALSPYLLDPKTNKYSATGLFFDLEKIKGYRQIIYIELARFFKNVVDKGYLKYSQSAFFRYLSSPDHCNLALSEKSLKSLILKAKSDYF